jgi:hypothetical protein
VTRPVARQIVELYERDGYIGRDVCDRVGKIREAVSGDMHENFQLSQRQRARRIDDAMTDGVPAAVSVQSAVA